MAEKQAAANENETKKQPTLGDKVAGALGKVWDFVTGSEYVNAMARQGANELGSALKAFPDSVSEYRYVHAADEPDSPSTGRALWPSEIAQANREKPAGLEQGKDTGKGHENGHEAGCSM
jgi:hypothetical protein